MHRGPSWNPDGADPAARRKALFVVGKHHKSAGDAPSPECCVASVAHLIEHGVNLVSLLPVWRRWLPTILTAVVALLSGWLIAGPAPGQPAETATVQPAAVSIVW